MNSERPYKDGISPTLGCRDPLQLFDMITFSWTRLPPEHSLAKARKATFVGLYTLHEHS